MHLICSLEIKVNYFHITAFLCYFLFGPSLTSARNQMAPAILTVSVQPRFKLPRQLEMRLNAVGELFDLISNPF